MREISVGGAISSGFRLIGREPVAFAAWCGVYFVLSFLPQMLTRDASMRMLSAMGSPEGANSPAVLQAQAEVFRYMPLTYGALLLIMLLVPPAVFRAVLYPDDRRFQYLRLGARELWMLLSVIVVTVLFFLGYIVALIPVVIVSAAGAAGGGGAGAVIGLLLIFPALGFLIWGLIRLSFAPVMAFAGKTFDIPGAWNLAKGHAGKMFLVWLALIVITFGVEIVIFGFAFVALGGVSALQSGNPMEMLARMTPAGSPVMGVIFALLGAWIYVMWSAAWAEMYRDLKVVDADVFA